jgi:hypothetical protein
MRYKWFVIYNKMSPTGARNIVIRKIKPKIVKITAISGKSATIGKTGIVRIDSKKANKPSPKWLSSDIPDVTSTFLLRACLLDSS